MRLRIVLAAIPVMTVAAHAAEVTGSSRIDQVTVFPAGAEITRLGKVKIERGEHVILFTDLPARALPGSIRVEGKATGRLAIGSVDTRKAFVPRADDSKAAPERKRLEEAIEKLRDERAQLQASLDAAEAQKVFIANLAQLPSRPGPANGTPSAQPDWGQLFSLIGQRHAEAQKAVLDVQLKMREVDRQIKDLEGKLAALAPRQEERTEVKIFVSAGANLEADLVIRYQVGAASWTPYYDARLSTGTKAETPKLVLERRASIQQRSGESWENVALALSTTRPGSSTAAPELRTVTIDYEPDVASRPLPPPAPMAMAPRSVGPAKIASGGADEEAARERAQRQEVVRADDIRATIDAQGFQAIYAIAGRVTVPATGEAKRVQIDDAQLEPSLVVRTVPKRDTKAFLYAKATMAKGTPILPGAVSLFRDGTFVGTGTLPQLAPGEEHELGFGVDDAVRVRHAVVEEKRGETGLITSSKTDVRNYRISVKNLHERAIPVSVQDQIPVSQNQDIKVELLGKSAPSKRDVDDKRGVLAWDLSLAPDEEKVVEFGYRATWPGAKRIQYR